MERKKYENPQLTSTPRVCRRPYSLQEAFIEVSPILPIKAYRQRCKSLIPVSTENRLSLLFNRRKTEFGNNGDNSIKPKITAKLSRGPALSSIPKHDQCQGDNSIKPKITAKLSQGPALSSIPKHDQCQGDNSIKPKITAKLSQGPGLSSIPEHDPCQVMAVPQSIPSCTNILKESKISNLAQVEWLVPKEIKKRFSLKNKINNPNNKESVFLNPEWNTIKECVTEDEMSPLELCHSTKKRRIVDPKNNNQNNPENKKTSIENQIAPVLSEDGLQIHDSKLEVGQRRGSKLKDNLRNNDDISIRTQSNRLNKRKHDNISHDSSKPHLKENCQDNKKSQSKATLKSKQTTQKEIKETPKAGMSEETNNAKLCSEKQLPKSKASKRKNNLTKDGHNEFIDNADSKPSFIYQNNIKSEGKNVELNLVCEPTIPKLRKKQPQKKNNSIEMNIELSSTNNEEQITMVKNNKNDTTKGRKTRKVGTKTIKTVVRPENDMVEVQKNKCTMEQHNFAIESDSTISSKSNNKPKTEKTDSTKGSAKKEVLKGRRGKAVPIDKLTKKSAKDGKDQDGNIKMGVCDNFKSQQINNITCIIANPKNNICLNADIDINNGINDVENSKVSHRNVPGAQELNFKHVGKESLGNESNKDKGLTHRVNDYEKKSTNETNDMIIQEKTCINNKAELLITSESRKRKLNSNKNNQDEFVLNQELHNKTQQIDNRTCIIVHKDKHKYKDNQKKTSEEIISDNVDDKLPEDVVLQTGKVQIKLKRNAKNKSKPNHKDSKLNKNGIEKVPEEKNNNKVKCTIDRRNVPEKVKCNTKEESSNLQESVFEVNNPKLISKDDNKATESMRKETLKAVNHLTEKESLKTKPLDVKQCIGLKTGKLTEKEGILMQTLVNVRYHVATGIYSIQPGASLNKSSTDTTYFVISGAAKVRIGSTTRIIRCQDVNCSFVTPKYTDFSITNTEDVLLKMYFTKFASK